MSNENFFITWLRRFGIIHGFAMISIYVIASIANINITVNLDFLGKMILFSLAGTLPGIVYYSRREYSEKECLIRTVIHFILLIVFLVPLAYWIGLWKTTKECFLIIGVIFIVDLLVHFSLFGLNWYLAAKINQGIRNKRRK